MFKAAFIFLAKGADPKVSRSEVTTQSVILTTIGVKSYEEAVEVSRELYADNYGGIELCAGFGHRGVAMIAEAVDYKIPVGVVRFDFHPNMGHKSGDEFF